MIDHRIKKLTAAVLYLLLLIGSLRAYQNLDLPIDRDMSRSEVDRILGRPGFLICTGMSIRGLREKLDVCMTGYRIPDKNGAAKLLSIIFFQDNIQLSVSAYYGKKDRDKLLARILKTARRAREISLRGLQGYLDHENLDLYIVDFEKNGPSLPPKDLGEYLQSENLFNAETAEAVAASVKQLRSSKFKEGLYGITYMNLRLVASVASQPK